MQKDTGCLIPEEGISKEHGQVRTLLLRGNSLLFSLPSKKRLSCQNVGLGPDWSFEWIFTSLISATANRRSSKASRENRGGSGVEGFRITLPGFGSAALVD